jgi:hypothetical protein
MKGIFVANHGTDENGVITYRINGEKDDLHYIVNKAVALGFEFCKPPVYEKSHKHYSVLLQLYIPMIKNDPEKEVK